MDRIFLRVPEERDIDDIFEIDSDPLVHEFIGKPKSRSQSENGLAYLIKNQDKMRFGVKAIVLEMENKVIGYCGMQPLKSYGYELFFGLNSKYWGKGYCRQAVRVFIEVQAKELTEIFAAVHPGNVRSQAVLENVGFKYEKNIYYEPQEMEHKLYIRTMAIPSISRTEKIGFHGD